MKFVVLVAVASMLAATFVTLPLLVASTLDGLQGIAVGFLATWLTAIILSALAYVRYGKEIKKAIELASFLLRKPKNAQP